MDSLEHRIGLLELGQLQFKKAQIPDREDKAEDDPEFSDINISISSLFETKLGEYGLAWLRNIILFFCNSFFFGNILTMRAKPVISLIVGIVSVTGVFVMSHYILLIFRFAIRNNHDMMRIPSLRAVELILPSPDCHVYS